MGFPKTFLIFGESGGTSRPHQLAEWFGLCDLVAERDCKKQVYYIHSSTAAMKNMPMILIVSITKLITLFSITIQILQLNNLVFQILCKGTALKRHYKSEATKKMQKKFVQKYCFYAHHTRNYSSYFKLQKEVNIKDI